MNNSQLISLTFLLSIWTISSCFPTKPLNERSTQLTWQAWLLIDESQQNNKQDNTFRRRITPKSVFIAPSFSPESLPECSEGYQSDPMGRCIKIIMLDKQVHLDFLLQQLNQKFSGDYDDYGDYEVITTTTTTTSTNGPININIPLEIAEETDVAIVVAPTNNILQQEQQEQQQQNAKLNKTLSEEKMNVEDIAGILGIKKINEIETTTITEIPTDTTTIELPTTTTITTTTIVDNTTPKLNALFFLDPKRQIEVKTDRYDQTTTLDTETTEYQSTTEMSSLLQMDQALPYSDILVPFNDIKREAVKSNTINNLLTNQDLTTTTIKSATQENDTSQKETTTIKIQEEQNETTTVKTENKQNETKTVKVEYEQNETTTVRVQYKQNETTARIENNKQEETTTTKMEGTTVRIENETIVTPTTTTTTTTTSKIESNDPYMGIIKIHPITKEVMRFPSYRLRTTTTVTDPTENASKRFETILNQYSDNKTEQENINKSEKQNDLLYQRYKAHRENHRNREKHSEWFHLPTKWTDNTQKPVVLRFSRKHGYIDSQQLGSNNFYKEINPRLFGFSTRKRITR